jgi:3-hydroxyanthranilate 3,4-dioxygenase
MVLRIQEDGKARDIPIRAGETFLLPARVPHSPQRMEGSVGLVIERRRQPQELDGFAWFCPRCDTQLYEEYLHVSNIVTQLPPVFDRFYSSREHRTCKACGHLNPAPAKYTMPDT